MNGRDEFQKMMQDCRRGQHDYIITKSVTRFARNTVDSIQAIRELKALGIGIYFEKERVDTLSEKSEQLLTILSSLRKGNQRIFLQMSDGLWYGDFKWYLYYQ